MVPRFDTMARVGTRHTGPRRLTRLGGEAFHGRDRCRRSRQLVDAHWRDVARLAHSLAGPGEGDDVAQQAWTQALAAYPRVTSTANLRSWLMTITARCAMDGHRAPGPSAAAGRDAAGANGSGTQRAISLCWSRIRGPVGTGAVAAARGSARRSPCATSPTWTMRQSPRPWGRPRPRPDGWSATRWPPFVVRWIDEH